MIDQVYVKEGDKVKVGDKLLSYDTTLLELNLESYQLEGKFLIELEIKGAEKDLKKLKSITPVADSSPPLPHRIFPTGKMMTAEAILDSDSGTDDQAKAILNPMNLTAAAEGGEETQTPETAAAETAAPETQAPETSPETTAPETTGTGNSSAGNAGARDGSTGDTGSRDSGAGNDKSTGNDSARTIICRGCGRAGSGSRKF